jgi:hypothetical protein
MADPTSNAIQHDFGFPRIIRAEAAEQPMQDLPQHRIAAHDIVDFASDRGDAFIEDSMRALIWVVLLAACHPAPETSIGPGPHKVGGTILWREGFSVISSHEAVERRAHEICAQYGQRAQLREHNRKGTDISTRYQCE